MTAAPNPSAPWAHIPPAPVAPGSGNDARRAQRRVTDQVVATLYEPQQEKAYQPVSPRSRFLYERGYETKARAYDCCGSFSREWCCSEHHQVLAVETYSCHQRFCPYCGRRIADSRLHDSEKQIRRIRRLSAHLAKISCCFIQVKARCEGGPKALNGFWKTIFDPLKKLTKNRELPYFLQGHLPGYDGSGKLVWRAIYWGAAVTPQAFKSTIQAAIPEAEISILVVGNDQLRQFFVRLYAPLIPNDPIDQAVLEIAFTGVDQLRTSQTLTRLFPKDCGDERRDLIGNRLATTEVPAHARRCTKCGKPPDCVTEWHPHNITEAERTALKRYGQGEKPPPPRYPWH